MIRVRYDSNLKLIADVRDFQLKTDIMKGQGGDDTAPEPLEFFISSLGLCIGIYFVFFCRSRDIAPEGFEITVDYEMASAPKRVGKFSVNLKFPDGFPEKYKRAAKRFISMCPVEKTLEHGAEVELTLG